ncbi:hypothetical protein [Lentzea sp. CC55]|uniref:hypothetical protein n=1 Tax=Lentzea sp. CC55 TaxID=2884909 RepID=UPI001F1FAEFD|nr:hypothetical protein [Lentzea sp. CC55]MCG8926665.1 hypothetical protein [Lentzea sp. CC55]
MHQAPLHDAPLAGAIPAILVGANSSIREARTTPLLEGVAAGRVRFHLDTEEFDFYVDVAPGTASAWISLTLTYMALLGYEPIPLNECEAELLDDGWVRRYFVPIEPVEDGIDPVIVAPRVAA